MAFFWAIDMWMGRIAGTGDALVLDRIVETKSTATRADINCQGYYNIIRTSLPLCPLDEMNEPIKVFLSYSHQDDELRKELSSHLSSLYHNKSIEPWHDRDIDAGSDWAEAIDENLERAEIILLLVSADFINSRYCYSIEMQRALERHRAGSAVVIPVIVRDSVWTSSPLGALQAVPRDNKAVATWGDKFARDTAWKQVTEEIGKVARQIRDRQVAELTASQKAEAKKEFRAKAAEFYRDGILSPGEKALLDLKRKQLGLGEPEAAEILQAVAAAYRQHQSNLEEYRQVLVAELAGQESLRADQQVLLQQLQTALGLSDPEVEQVEQKVSTERALERQQAARRQEQDLVQQQQAAAEATYQEQLRRQAEAERQIELEQQRQAKEKQANERGQAGASSTSKPQNVTGVRLQSFDFAVITVDNKGNENSRTSKTAKFFAKDIGNKVLLEMVYIPGGTFQMGSPAGQGNDAQRPQHPVTVPAFLLGKYPVTQEQWRVVAALPQEKIALNTEPSHFKGDNRPVESVSWGEAVEFCQRLSRKTGHEYRLPSEAEWEYACRAGTKTEFYFGETLTPKLARCKSNFGMAILTMLAGETAPVGSYLPNTFGLFDLHGNVWEWCADRWHENYNGAPAYGSAWLNGESNRRVTRGGSWNDDPPYCRAAVRCSHSIDYRNYNVGFRVVCAVFPALFYCQSWAIQGSIGSTQKSPDLFR